MNHGNVIAVLVVCLSILVLPCHSQVFGITVFQPKMTTLTPTKASQLAALNTAAAAAGAAGSLVLVVPELYLTGYNLAAVNGAEPANGPSFQAVRQIAAKHNVSILYTYPEAGTHNTSGKVYDSAALIYRNGTTLASYRKVNLAAGEGEYFTAGDAFAPVVDLDGVRVGILICFDVYLPEPARILSLRGAQLILIPTANGYPEGINVVADLVVPTRSLENSAVVAYVNWVQQVNGAPEYLTYYGQTQVSSLGTSLYSGPAFDSALQHVSVNITGFSPSTVFTRPLPDLKGLCGNFSGNSN